jgi:FKBP-type peptidyl-prolyl cis-trans isomerase
MIRINRHITILALPALILALSAGCLKNDLEEKEANEKKLIQQYLTSNDISADTKTEGGIYYVEDIAGMGLSPVIDNYVVINYTGRYLENDAICETSDSTLKDEWPAAEHYEYYLYGPTKFKYGHNIAGINEGLALMKEGGKAKIIIPSDKAFGDWNPLVYEIELIKVIKDPVAYEDSVLNAYLDEKGFNASTKLDSIWFKETFTPDPTDLRTVQTNDTVFFSFTGRLIDGFGNVLQDNRIFDTNIGDSKPVKLVFGKTSTSSGSGVILALPAGLIMALDSMRIGTHATAVLPYRQAFGAGGLYHAVPTKYTIVPQYQTVVYDIVLEDIRPPAGK